jgi:hypothetical protein
MGGMRRAAIVVGALAVIATPVVATGAGQAGATPPAVRHVFTIVLENTSWETVNSQAGRAAMPYLHSLESQGVQLDQMYGVSHASLTNYIGVTSGNSPNAKTKADCKNYDCVFEAPDDENVGDQLEGAGYTWKGYMESMPQPCAHGAEAAPDPYVVGYATRHNPFMYYRSIVGDQTRCDEHDVPFAPDFANDLAADNAPNYSFIVPDTCNDAHDGGASCGLDDADAWLQAHVPAILASPQYQADGMLVITFDESDFGDLRGCCGGTNGGRMYTLVLSPFVAQPGRESTTPYSHYSLLRTVEDMFGLPCLRHACDAASVPLGDDVFSPAPDDFSLRAPHVGVKAGTSSAVTLSTAVTNGSSQPLTLSATSRSTAVGVTFVPATIQSGETANVVVSVASGLAATSTTVDVRATGATTSHSFPLGVDVVTGTTKPDQLQNGNFETGARLPWTKTVGQPAVIAPGATGNSAIRLPNNAGIAQVLNVSPAASTLRLSVRTACGDPRDKLIIKVLDTVTKATTFVVNGSCVDSGGTWLPVTADATSWRGRRTKVIVRSLRGYMAAPITVDADEISID